MKDFRMKIKTLKQHLGDDISNIDQSLHIKIANAMEEYAKRRAGENSVSQHVVRSVYSEMEFDNNQVQNDERYTKGFKEGYDEALRNLRVIIKQEFEIDVRK